MVSMNILYYRYQCFQSNHQIVQKSCSNLNQVLKKFNALLEQSINAGGASCQPDSSVKTLNGHIYLLSTNQ